jgi:class 3 adenylate cyclase/CHASE2 domain-containing sensor protein
LLITATVIGLTILLRLVEADFLTRIENASYDLRVRSALHYQPPVATNLGFVCIDEDTIRAVRRGDFGYNYGLYWPRQVYGRLVEELAAQGAKVVAFDVVFGERRFDHPLAKMADGTLVESDEFLGLQMRRASNTVLAVTSDLLLPELFRTNAVAVGDIRTEKDSDGILRRVRAFRLYQRWHPAFLQVQADPDMGVDLLQARVEPGRIVLPRSDGSEIPVALDADGNFDVADFWGDKLPAGMARKARPFTDERVWHMGIVIAARELNLDLDRAEVDLAAGRVVLRGAGGVERVLPVDHDGYFLIDWCLPPTDPRLFLRPMHVLLAQDFNRLQGREVVASNAWRGRLVVVGSAAAGGNDLTDFGATPLLKNTLLVSKHWNVANSVIMGRFIRPFTLAEELALIVLLGALSAWLACRLRPLFATVSVAGLAAFFVFCCFGAYIQWRIWVPTVLPGACALLAWASLTTWRVLFEQTERQRVKSVFSRIVSPNVVHELLQAEKLSLGGARREVTVFFADVRGFTELTDASHEAAAEHVRASGLSGAPAAAYFDQQAEETLATVNLYLSKVADRVKQHDGTLDKYIGDCVMAFWGAPTPNKRHALDCVRAAIDAQRSIHELNAQRAAENRRIDQANQTVRSSPQDPQPLLPLLTLGSGINTGLATVGLMGSDAHILNYTVFGRDVNLASRLESVSGRGRIIISAATYQHLRRDDPKLADTCIELPPVEVKGFREVVRIYEVPWQNSLPG